MDANQNNPSEMNIQESEEFFSGVDAVTGIPNGNPFASNSGMWMSEVRHFTLQDLDEIFNRGIHVTALAPPEQGWPVACHCSICKETVFLLSPWATKPKDGDYWKMEICTSEKFGYIHNMQFGMKGLGDPFEIKPGSLDWMKFGGR